MNRDDLFRQISKKESFLCVGLDTDLTKIPRVIRSLPDPIFEFNRRIIDATIPYAVAYKPNIAFYEALGVRGWESLQKTVEYLPDTVLKISDAKRADIGNTSNLYAQAFFEEMNFDAITVAPYMGRDSVEPFLNCADKWAIILGATSNPGHEDFQNMEMKNGDKLFETVLKKTSEWGNMDNTMYVVGATRPELLKEIRKIIPDHFLLIPGVGAQGGSLKDVCKYGMNPQCGLLVNSSRGIIYADDGPDFDKVAGKVAKELRDEMKEELREIL
jgi:orotidine-5'-phosphate decarboxylase